MRRQRKGEPNPRNETPAPSYAEIARIRKMVPQMGGSVLTRPHIRRIDKVPSAASIKEGKTVGSGYTLCGCGQKALVTLGRGVALCIVCDAMDHWPTFKDWTGVGDV